jgi:hypothetical protein
MRVFHWEGFVNRVGLLDHLSGTHKICFDAAASPCPDGAGTCIFPAYRVFLSDSLFIFLPNVTRLPLRGWVDVLRM